MLQITITSNKPTVYIKIYCIPLHQCSVLLSTGCFPVSECCLLCYTVYWFLSKYNFADTELRSTMILETDSADLGCVVIKYKWSEKKIKLFFKCLQHHSYSMYTYSVYTYSFIVLYWEHPFFLHSLLFWKRYSYSQKQERKKFRY